MSGDFDVVDIEGAFDKIVIMNCSSELIRCYGKISVLHLTCERFAQGLVETLGTVDVPLIARHKKRGEEWDALDMIPMRMADQDVAAQALGAARHQLNEWTLTANRLLASRTAVGVTDHSSPASTWRLVIASRFRRGHRVSGDCYLAAFGANRTSASGCLNRGLWHQSSANEACRILAERPR